MKLDVNPRLAMRISKESEIRDLVYHLQRHLTAIATEVNLLAEGAIEGRYAATDTAPTGVGKNADIIWRKTVSEAGTAGSKYVHVGHICVASGDPATWVPIRWLTGN